MSTDREQATTVEEAKEQLDKMKHDISVYLNNKFSRFKQDTGLVVTYFSADVITLTGGFPKKKVEGVVTNVDVRTDLGST